MDTSSSHFPLNITGIKGLQASHVKKEAESPQPQSQKWKMAEEQLCLKINIGLLIMPTKCQPCETLYPFAPTWQETGRFHGGQLQGHGGPRAKPGILGALVLKALPLPHVGEGKACFPSLLVTRGPETPPHLLWGKRGRHYAIGPQNPLRWSIPDHCFPPVCLQSTITINLHFCAGFHRVVTCTETIQNSSVTV